MKKRVIKMIDPLDRELDFSTLGRVRRNAFAGSGQRGGPSLAALWEMPELESNQIMLRRGRPAKGPDMERTSGRSERGPDMERTSGRSERGPVRKTVAKSIRLPEAIWKQFEKRAKSKHLGIHQAMRTALLSWLKAD
jgi:hypothetical protein